MGIKYINAKRLRLVLLGGGKWLQKYEAYLNELNVYPVPDGDTGTNMCMTVQNMVNEIEKNTNVKTSMKQLSEVVEDAVLIGARGNSGTILSQVINGFLKSIEDKKRLVPADITNALEESRKLAYSVVSNPVEGTMLTVIRLVSKKAFEIKDYEFFGEYIDELVKTAKDAVEDTPNLLPKLKEAGVVDSGAQGLFYFFEGMQKVLEDLDILNNAQVEQKDFDRRILDINHDLGEIKFKYCTEFIILNEDFDKEKLENDLLEIGDSAVFAKSSKKFKAHIHTNNPGLAIEMASSIGDLKNIKIENMKLQNEGVLENEKNLAKIFVNKKIDPIKKEAYIVISDTEILKDEMLKYGADVVLLGGQSQNPSVQDILSAISKIDYNDKVIYILANNKNVISTAKLASDKTDKTVVVVPTKTMLEGIIYLKYKYTHMTEKNDMLNRNYSIEITTAVRDTKVDNIDIKVGDYLLLLNTKIKYASSSMEDIINYVTKNYVTNNTINITVVTGLNKHEKITKNILDLDYNIKLIESNMPNYDYYILIENKKENMPEIAIITDSASDLSESEAVENNIVVIPIRMTDNDGLNYKDGVNLSKTEFWNMLVKDNKEFKTAQPSPKEIVNIYLEQFEKGYKKVLVLPISSRLSGEYQVLKLAREISKRESDITIFDTKSVSVLQGHLVKSASLKTKVTNDIESIIKDLTKIREKSKMYIVIDSLKYLHKGGRISKAAQTIGDFLGLKPVITMIDGVLTIEKKVFGGKNCVINYIGKSMMKKYGNQSIYLFSAYGGTRDQLEFANNLNKKLTSINRKANMVNTMYEIGPTVGAHSGPVSGVVLVPKLI